MRVCWPKSDLKQHCRGHHLQKDEGLDLNLTLNLLDLQDLLDLDQLF